ncbi:MAG TPA: APC family permease [Gammaproteobacteria bacterium]|nr:APC family permease [Gammaproteobacteria bacterium]
MTSSATPTVVRAIGRLSLAGLVLNSIVGTGVFVLPGTVGRALGWPVMYAWVAAAAASAVMIFCFAEVASRFTQAGGAYLYGKVAFGPFAGIQLAWLSYLVRCLTAAVQANLFTTYLAELWPGAAARPVEVAVTAAFIGVHALVNVRGVGTGAKVSDVFAIVKILPLAAFGVLGILWLALGRAAAPAIASDPTLDGWLSSVVLLMFAYGGFESALIPAAEAKDARRDAPFALLVGLALATLVYLAAQLAVLATLTEPAATDRPLAASARVMLGTPGAVAITLAALLSVYGWMASNMLNVPRLTMAMAERGDLPAWFGKVHPRFRTPWISILLFAAVSLALALQAGLLENLSLSAVSRLLLYGSVCAALPVFRARERRGVRADGVHEALFPVRGGVALAVIGVALSLVLVTRMNAREGLTMALTAALAALHWSLVRKEK